LGTGHDWSCKRGWARGPMSRCRAVEGKECGLARTTRRKWCLRFGAATQHGGPSKSAADPWACACQKFWWWQQLSSGREFRCGAGWLAAGLGRHHSQGLALVRYPLRRILGTEHESPVPNTVRRQYTRSSYRGPMNTSAVIVGPSPWWTPGASPRLCTKSHNPTGNCRVHFDAAGPPSDVNRLAPTGGLGHLLLLWGRGPSCAGALAARQPVESFTARPQLAATSPCLGKKAPN